MIQAKNPSFIAARQWVIFANYAHNNADRVLAGEMTFQEAVDDAYEAARWHGLVIAFGDDAIQGVLAGAFAGVPR